ncbi:unnamed protein product [Schistocephalus solidus]|uniref:BHLH domain-containing protein n=1 Tax=Schistocephalus solidus TaxID=70667 RepID=A0A183SFA7_SCHSO|nr:unnamed protein product [Schistocephalus solidus]
MDVTGTDPRTRAGLFLWPWAATGYSNMSTNVANGVASTTAQSLPNAPAASLGLPHVTQMTGPGMFGAGAGPGNSQPTDDAFESFYSRLSYSTSVHSSHMSSLQQQMQQREQRSCEAPNSDMQGTRVSMIQGQQSLQHQQQLRQQQHQTSGTLSGLHRGEQQQQGPFADQRLMNGMMHRPSQQQAAAAIAAIASAAASRNSAAAAVVAASAPTANSASSSPLNSGAFHNPPLSPQVPLLHQHPHLGHPLHQQKQQQQQRPYSSTGSLHNVSTTVPSSPLDGRMSSSASPSVSSAAAGGNYCLKRHPPNDFNSATAMALAVAVAAGDRHAQMQQQQQQELSGGVVGSRSPPDQLHHTLGGHIASTADVFSAAAGAGPGPTPTQYLFPPSSPIKSFYRRPSEAAAMAAAMAAQAARDASGGMNVHAGVGGDRSMSMAAHQRLLGGHGGFLLSNMGAAAAAAAAAVSSSAHSPLDRVPDFLSDMRLGQETPVSTGTGGSLQQGGPGSNQSIGQSHSGLGGLTSETALDTLPSLYGHAAKGYKCKICQHRYGAYRLVETKHSDENTVTPTDECYSAVESSGFTALILESFAAAKSLSVCRLDTASAKQVTLADSWRRRNGNKSSILSVSFFWYFCFSLSVLASCSRVLPVQFKELINWAGKKDDFCRCGSQHHRRELERSARNRGARARASPPTAQTNHLLQKRLKTSRQFGWEKVPLSSDRLH